MQKNVYIKFPLSAKVNKLHVTVNDVAKVYCEDRNLQDKIRSLKIYSFHNPKNNRIIFSSIKVIEIISSKLSVQNISHMGEADFLIEYEPLTKTQRLPSWINALLCCIITFFGSALAIMTFNTEVCISELFKSLYRDITGMTSDGTTILEFSYSIGIGLGIIIFYNHFGKKRLSTDPTPVELEMKKYETEIKKALIDSACTAEEHIDVN